METHVKVLGVLHIVLGALGIFCALILMVVLGGAVTAVAAEGDPDAAFAIPILGITGGAMVAFLVLASLPGMAAGWGLIKFRPWARILALVLSILALILFPFGTLIGIYGLWVLLNKDTERLFVPAQA
ncbi:MAG TPA: hypothetical protein VHJ77_06585 [Vicinamibacterales bacterium]|jgi:hypothetical protein|nr:hypothetical protein [Vicinamibacterales bacterium]